MRSTGGRRTRSIDTCNHNLDQSLHTNPDRTVPGRGQLVTDLRLGCLAYPRLVGDIRNSCAPVDVRPFVRRSTMSDSHKMLLLSKGAHQKC
jgi:hypothetical protein